VEGPAWIAHDRCMHTRTRVSRHTHTHTHTRVARQASHTALHESSVQSRADPVLIHAVRPVGILWVRLSAFWLSEYRVYAYRVYWMEWGCMVDTGSRYRGGPSHAPLLSGECSEGTRTAGLVRGARGPRRHAAFLAGMGGA